MPTNLLLLPLLGGYWFLHTFHYTKFKSQRLDGYRLLVESALAGVVFTTLGWLACKAIWYVPGVRETWLAAAPKIDYLGTAIVSLTIGITSPYVLNTIIGVFHPMIAEDAQLSAILRHGNHLLRLLHIAAVEEKPISLTLDSRKVYIGALAGVPNLEPHDVFVAVIPFFSGYRDKDTLRLTMAVDYLGVYEQGHVDIQDFRVVIPISSIRTASFFDQRAYPAFEVEEPTQPGAPIQGS